MSAETVTLVWLIAGVALMALELLLPGLVVIFLGAAACLVAGVRWLGWVEGLLPSLTTWFVLSIVLVVALRGVLARLVPGEREFTSTDEDMDAYDKIVEVSHTIDQGTDGRIRFGGSSWQARTMSGTIEAGRKARIAYRDNVSFVVEPADELEARLADNEKREDDK